MKIARTTLHVLLPLIMSIARSAFGAPPEITNLGVVSDDDTVRITVEMTAPVTPSFWAINDPCRLIFDFPNVRLHDQAQRIPIDHDGIGEAHAEIIPGIQPVARISVDLDTLRRFGIKTMGNTVVLTILPQPLLRGNACAKAPVTGGGNRFAAARPGREVAATSMASLSMSAPLEVMHVAPVSSIDELPGDTPATVHRRFKIKFVSGKTAYINGGSNAGLRIGMNLDIRKSDASSTADKDDAPLAAARIIGIATTSAILEVGNSNGEFVPGDWADLLPGDAEAARRNVAAGPGNLLHAIARPVDEDTDAPTGAAGRHLHAAPGFDDQAGTRTAGRIGLDYSGITSGGSTPGASYQLGMSVQSDIRHILGTHWNLEGYWRGRINRHSQFEEPTIEDSLNKTYTMQLFYDNPDSRWLAGVGRLYLPWAVSLDTVDGGYFGRKFGQGNTSGVFAGSTPDPSSWHYRPNQRIAGAFTNFEGGDYDSFHYSSTTGVALTSIGWKLDRPFVFFENEASYHRQVSVYHSLIYDSPQGVSTNGIRPGAGVSHSYFTFHYQPRDFVSFDLYHNFFRDVPTAVTSIVGTGLVDKLLFQGISAGTHLRPTRYFTVYTTLGASKKTGDAHRSLDEMFGATWYEVARTGIRADFHYSKFDSNFGSGHYDVLSVSRQVTNRMFWNVQLGRQGLASMHTANLFSNFLDDSVDINLGRHSYLQSGYTWVRGDSMKYRQWYMSWGYRFDEGKSTPQFIQTGLPGH